MNKFEKTLRQTNTFLSKEDLNMIKTQYGEKKDKDFGMAVKIDYDLISQNLMGSGSKNKAKFDLMRKTHTRLNNIKKAFGGMNGQSWVDYRLDESLVKSKLKK